MQVERAIRRVLAAHLREHPQAEATADVRVARTGARGVEIVGVGAVLGRTTSPRKMRSSRANGMLGGRPRARRAR